MNTLSLFLEKHVTLAQSMHVPRIQCSLNPDFDKNMRFGLVVAYDVY